MRNRFIAAISLAVLMLLAVPGALAFGATPEHTVSAQLRSATDGQSIHGAIKGPDNKPIANVKIVASQDGKDIGEAVTDATGAWSIAVPAAGNYTVKLDLTTLPATLQPRIKGGEEIKALIVPANQAKSAIFPLSLKSQAQINPDTGASTPGTQGADGGTLGTSPNSSVGFGDRAVQLFVGGLQLGAIIAITSVGLSLVFGTTRLINFAHGELVTIGAMTAYFFSSGQFAMPLVLAAILAILVGALAGGAMDLIIWRPMRKRSAGLIQMFIISIGLSLLLRHLLLVFFGSRRQQYHQYTLQKAMDFGPISITPRDLIVTLLSVAVLLGVAFLLLYTRIGKATRAVADNKDLAEASGIDVNRIILIVWLLGGGLAALGGVFYGLSEAVYWDMGFNLLLLMFAGVILGGLGSAFGAVVGSFVVGLVAQMSTLWFSPELQNAWALLALIIVLLVRPQGILGRVERAG